MLRRAEEIKAVLSRMLSRMGISERLKEADVVRRFAEIVGARISERAEAIAIKNGVLQVRVESPVWRQELTYSKPEIIESLNTALGETIVTDIYFSG
jgi:predicted nucleic acid-binding Zn ribbon protein